MSLVSTVAQASASTHAEAAGDAKRMYVTQGVQPGTWQADFAALVESLKQKRRAREAAAVQAEQTTSPEPTLEDLQERERAILADFDPYYLYSDAPGSYATGARLEAELADVRRQIKALQS